MSDAKCQIKSTMKATFRESSARQRIELSEYVQLTDLSWFVDTDVYVSQTHTSHCHLELSGCNISILLSVKSQKRVSTPPPAAKADVLFISGQGWHDMSYMGVIRKWLGAMWCRLSLVSLSFFSGAGGHHRGPPGGGDPPVSRVLPSLLLSGPLPHAPPAPLPGSPSLHPQLSLFLPPCQSRGAAPPPVLPAPPPPHVRRSRYGHADWT